MPSSCLGMGPLRCCALIVLYLFHKRAYGANYTCEILKDRTCLGSMLDYNLTTVELVTDSRNQEEVNRKLEEWEGLKFLPKCWSVLQPLLCQVYKPRCQNSSVKKPCRKQCEATREPCSVVERYNKEWPEFLKCEQFPKESNCEVSLNRKTINLYIRIEWYALL